MAQGSWVREDEKTAILETAKRLQEDEDLQGDVTAEAIIEEMLAETTFPKRSPDKIKKLLAEWRRKGILRRARSSIPMEERPSPQEEDWNIGAASPQWVPYEVLPTVGKLWEWCLVTGQKLTIREAKWAGILSSISPIPTINGPSDCWRLYRWATEYARREWACEQLNKPVNTTDLDSRLILRWWLKDVATMTGELPKQHTFRVLKRKETEFVREDQPSTGFITSMDVVFRLNMGREVDLFGLSEDADRLFAILLRYMAKGPKWESMSQEVHVSIANRLLVFAKETAEEIKSLPTIRDPFGRGEPELRPIELLKEVGYDD